MNELLALAFEIELSVVLWEYYKTKKFYKLMSLLDETTHIIARHIDKAIKRLEEKNRSASDHSDKSVLGKH